jgi:hypothetical protein
MKYFNDYPLRGHRKIDCLRWMRVHYYKEQQKVVTEKAAEKLANLLLKLEKPSESNYSLDSEAQKFSNEEVSIFSSLSLNQRNPNYKSVNKVKSRQKRYNEKKLNE